MGLDFRLSHKEDSIMEGNGRTAFAFVREWVESKGADKYGKDILLTKEDLEWLFNKGVEQYVGVDKGWDYPTIESFKNEIVNTSVDNFGCFRGEELLQKLLLIYAMQDFENYYLECDW